MCVCQDDAETAGFALDGLKQVMAVKSRSVLPYLVPKVSRQHPHPHPHNPLLAVPCSDSALLSS